MKATDVRKAAAIIKSLEEAKELRACLKRTDRTLTLYAIDPSGTMRGECEVRDPGLADLLITHITTSLRADLKALGVEAAE